MPRGKRKISSLRTVGTFLNGRACSDTLFHVLGGAYGHPLPSEELALQPMAGGILQHGYQCGLVWGAALAAGARAHDLLGPGPRAESAAIEAARRIVDAFRRQNTHLNCMEITDIDKSSSTMKMVTYFLLKGGTIACFRRAARYAHVAFDAIETALEEGSGSASVSGPEPDAPTSCASLLLRRMGASEPHQTMAAGFAGGIGLSGGACGALGAALWFLGARRLAEGATKLEWKDPRSLALIDRFIKASDYEFECSAIVGRTFESVADHADHVRGGGCAAILETLAEG